MPGRLRRAWWCLTPWAGGSLRREARQFLPTDGRTRLVHAGAATRRVLGRYAWLLYVVAAFAGSLPLLEVDWGPLGDPQESAEYLGTLWQVVGAALGLSVAMIGFVFEAFVGATNRSLGGSLSEFARATKLQLALRLGFTSLFATGLVLLGVGYDAPGGFAALWAILLSATTLFLALPFVFSQILRVLEFDYLVALRGKQIDKLAEDAMRQQLRGQACEALVEQQKTEAGVARGLWVGPGRRGVPTVRHGVIRDVRIDRLRHLAKAAGGIDLLVTIGDRVVPQQDLLAVEESASGMLDPLRRTIRIRPVRRAEVDARERLAQELQKLHEVAKAAIRDRRAADWNTVSEIYRRALLAMPRATQAASIPFEGAVSAPGTFGLGGPLDLIQRFLYDEMEEAIKTGDRRLALDVAYFPISIATEAADLDARGLVNAMLDFYPILYRLAGRAES